jgi:hypothetical protein
MAQEGSQAPKRRDTSPAFHKWFVPWVKGIVDLAFKRADPLDVCNAAVTIPVKRQVGLAEICPVEILRLDESDYQRIGHWGECRCDGSVYAWENVSGRRDRYFAV